MLKLVLMWLLKQIHKEGRIEAFCLELDRLFGEVLGGVCGGLKAEISKMLDDVI